MDGKLPVRWAWTTLAEASEVILGQSPPSDTYNTEGNGLPFFQGKAERRAAPGNIILNPDSPAMKLDNVLYNGKAESRPPLFTASAGIDTVETFEEPGNACRRYSRAGITD